MLRRAVIQRLSAYVHLLGGRVYQSFLAPPNTARPYATVKLPTQRGSVTVGFAGTQPVEVRIYDDPASFSVLDEIEDEVRRALHGVELDDPGGRYVLHWEPGGGDFQQDEPNLIGRLVTFEAAVVHERGT